jgi:hypothetical protein
MQKTNTGTVLDWYLSKQKENGSTHIKIQTEMVSLFYKFKKLP